MMDGDAMQDDMAPATDDVSSDMGGEESVDSSEPTSDDMGSEEDGGGEAMA